LIGMTSNQKGKRREKRSSAVLNASLLNDLVRRVVRAAQPQKIILFGSAARNEMGPHSDVDLLVIKPGRFRRGRLTEAIYRSLRGAGAPVDVVVVSPDDVDRYGEDSCMVIAPALREGKVVYGA
jgi:predicted nucleotidyltransferase